MYACVRNVAVLCTCVCVCEEYYNEVNTNIQEENIAKDMIQDLLNDH